MNFKLAVRSFWKSPVVTIVAVLSLALGIGANAAIFSLFHQILMRDVPVPAPQQLVTLSSPGPKQGSISCDFIADCDGVFSYPMFRDLQRLQTSFTGVAAHVFFNANLSYNKQTESGRGLMVSGSYFPVLNLRPALGRLIEASDDATIGEARVVVLSYAYWQKRFNSNAGVLNQQLMINGQPMTIVGVAPKGFDGITVGMLPQVFVPVTVADVAWPGTPDSWFQDRRSYSLYLFARLRSDVSVDQAMTAINGPYHNIVNDVDAPLQRMSEQTLARFKARELRLEPGRHGQSELHKDARTPLNLLLGVTAFVLLIACANVANLLLARSAKRTGELAVRLSIGGSRRQLIVQLLTESCLLAVPGGLLGLLVGHWTLKAISSIVPAGGPSIVYELDAVTLFFCAVLTLGTGILFGMFPAIHSTRPDLVSVLKGQSGQPSGSRGAARFRTVLATVQIALSMALLIIAGLFTKSLLNVSRVNLGFQVENISTFRVSPLLNGYPAERTMALYQRIEEELKSLPGVTSVTSSTVPVLDGDNWGTAVNVEGFESGPDIDSGSRYSFVGADYFRTFGIPLMAGREFTESDARNREDVAIVNEKFAQKFNLGRDAVGKYMSFRRDQKLGIQIIGVSRDAKYAEVKDEIPPVFYLPYRQRPVVSATNFYVRSAQDPQQILAAITPLMSRIDPNLPVEQLRTMPDQVKVNTTLDRVISILSAAFSGVATLLAAIGLYGVLAYTVAQRTREFGVRMALGAQPSRVRAMVLRQVGGMTAVGGLLGLAAALGMGKLSESLLFNLNGHDPFVLTAAILLLVLVALSAGFLPAQRASRVDPMRALRYE